MADAGQTCSIDEVVITDVLHRRPSRAADFQAENRALVSLAEAMGTDPTVVLQRLAEVALELTKSDSAGISLLEPGGEQGKFRWVATAGAWAPYRNGTMPREASPCGEVIARDATLLVSAPGRAFPALLQADPEISEGLLAPFDSDGKSAGTVWVIKHSPEKHFDREDARLLESLAQFASVAHNMVQALEGEKASRTALENELADKEIVNRRLREADTELRASADRQTFLLRLSDAIRPLADSGDIADAACRLLVEELAGSQAQYADLTGPPGEEMGEVRGAFVGSGTPFPQLFPLAPFGEPILATLRSGQTLQIDDVEVDHRLTHAQREAFQSVKAPAVVSVPLVKSGRWIAALTIQNLSARNWTAQDVAKVEDVAERTWAAVERASAEESVRRSEKHSETLLAELQHRVRNTLSVVRSIARRTAEGRTSPADFMSHFEGRLSAFSRVQAVVTRSATGTVSLRSLIQDELMALAAREGEHLHLSGPEICLKSRAAESMSLAIHELATNAMKYGAIAAPHGKVQVAWHCEPGEPPALHFEWREMGLDARPSAEREGFGHELLLRSLPYDLGAKTDIAFEEDGLRFTMTLPLRPDVVASAPSTPGK